MCCPLIPLPDFYTFDYDNPNGEYNWYPPVFIPIEITSMIALLILNPITIWALIRMQKKSKMKTVPTTVSIISNQAPSTFAPSTFVISTKAKLKKKNDARKQVIAFVQMGLVMLVFMVYMFWYYLFFYFIGMTTKWQTMMNSLFYTINNMINPFVYFVFKPKMREELMKTLICRKYN